MRGLVWYAAHAWDHLPGERACEAAVAKAHVTERALHVGRSAVELHGGIGFTWECDVQFWVKRTMFDRTWLGSPRAHRERVAELSGW
jgi:alkylation response protein AidB-like acyl-CoA dehydrogenase